ncbi:homeobox-like protein HDP1 [Parasteatoda tepidariorum]|uniref:homeobox-like protein HDP1 n=1 Tax=Parasteatoda tepidariorum TaxID=114398 RepID=UPI0039BD397A
MKSSSIFVGVIEKEKNESNLNNDIQDSSPIIIVHEEKVDSKSTQESNIYEKSEITEEPIDLLCNFFGGLSLTDTVIKNNHDKTKNNFMKVKEIHSMTESQTRTNKFKNNVAKNKNSKASSRKARKRLKVKSRLHTGIKSGSRLKVRSSASPPKSGLRNATQQNCRTVLGLSTTNYHEKAIQESNFSEKKEQMSFSKELEKHGLPTEKEIIEQNSPQRDDFEMNHIIKQNSVSEEPTINRESLQINDTERDEQQYLSNNKGFIKANKTPKYFLEEITARNLSDKNDSEIIKMQMSAFKKSNVYSGRQNLEKSNIMQDIILKDKGQNLSMRVDFIKTGNKHEFIPQEIPKQDSLEVKIIFINGTGQQFNLEKSNWQKLLDGEEVNIEQVFSEVKQQDLFKNKSLIKTDKKQEFILEEMTD